LAKDQIRLLFCQEKDKLRENGVGPSEPSPGEVGGVIFPKSFVHKVRASRRRFKGIENFQYFCITCAGEALIPLDEWGG